MCLTSFASFLNLGGKVKIQPAGLLLLCLVIVPSVLSVDQTNIFERYPGKLIRVAVGQNGVWGVNNAHRIYKKAATSWEKVAGRLKDISVGKNTVWGVNRNDAIYMRRMDGLDWEQIRGKLIQVSVSGFDDSVVWGVNSKNKIYRRRGNSWQNIDGRLKVVSCGQTGVWGVNPKNKIFYRKGTYGGGVSPGNGWERVAGRLKWVSAGAYGEVWGVGVTNKIFRREGVTEQNPTGTRWKRVQGSLAQVDVFRGEVWGVNADEQIFTSTTTPTTPPTQPPSSSCKCGVPQVDRNRIIGGQPATKNEYPWIVALVESGTTHPFCGGTLLSSKTVLTAAHCKGVQNSRVIVHVGEHDVTIADGEQKLRISSWTNHPQYNVNTQDNDFAIIQLRSDVTFSNNIMPICLPSPSNNYDARVSTVAGWGTRSTDSINSPNIPYEVDVDTITNTACTTNTLYNPGEVTANMICARESGKDACQGDSGGPLITKENTFFSLIGVVSWGIGCARPDAPGVYSRVTSQLDWINGLIKGDTCPKP